MDIIVRASGERTEQRCIDACKQQGNVHVIRARPFGEAIFQTYLLGLELGQKWTPVIDADVLLYDGILETAVRDLNKIEKRYSDLFCLDGVTDDKVLVCRRRAGVHIYRTELLELAIAYIDNENIKPESTVRYKMNTLGYRTWAGGKLVFGLHDYDQYYRDLWRKSVCQVWKLKSLIEQKGCESEWKRLAESDNDYRVIMAAHEYGLANVRRDCVMIDVDMDFNAAENLEKMGIEEKGVYA